MNIKKLQFTSLDVDGTSEPRPIVNNMKHTPEPWVVLIKPKGWFTSNVIVGGDGSASNTANVVFYVHHSHDMTNFRRAVACVNALAGLTSEEIEQVAAWVKGRSATPMFDLVAKNRLLQAQRDELFKVLEAVVKVGKGNAPSVGYMEELITGAEKAIAKAKGGQS